MFDTLLNEVLDFENGCLSAEIEAKDIWMECMNLEYTDLVLSEADGDDAKAQEVAEKKDGVLEKIKNWFKTTFVQFFSKKIPAFFKTAGEKIKNFFTKPRTIKVAKDYNKFLTMMSSAVEAYANAEGDEMDAKFAEMEELFNNSIAPSDKGKVGYIVVEGNVFKKIGVFFQNIWTHIVNGIKNLMSKFKGKMNKANSAKDVSEAAPIQKSAAEDVKKTRNCVKCFGWMFKIFKKKDAEEGNDNSSEA